ncbi:potassium channel family protein [Flavobacterium aciduliphilum]|jgi:hypothetical protein|uniref:Ion channel n=1 Tax=Flavobacterium aciduliphilum TaxID=1101402 RepID=A0A328Y832_9FLAO|nr:potassium channel family protein [Flavobacterium aciduliphilum]RAR70069.1 ion channel [Flavobacterium aciduliphilum]
MNSVSHFFRKLLLGKITKKEKVKHNPIQKRLLNIKAIWNNDHQDDNGLEKMVRLILSISQLFFPGIYLKYLACKKGHEYQDLVMDFYILAKFVFPILILKNHWENTFWMVGIMTYVLLETFLYIPTLIFASDLFSRPRSYKRSMLMLFFNYLEIICSFGVLYAVGGHTMNKPFTHWFDAIYFSLVSSNSIGFGDYYPVTTYGKVLVSIQAMFFLTFVVLFLNFFSTKVKNKGYFDDDEIA